MQKRSVALLAAMLFALSGILVKLMDLTTGEAFETSGNRSTVTATVATVRGTVYDRYLKKLTNAEQHYVASVIATPEAMAALSQSLPRAEWEAVSEQLQNGKPVILTSESPFPLANGIRQFMTTQRYTNTQPAAHTIGYLGDDGLHGACGIEQAFDTALYAATGNITVTYQTDGTGNVLIGGETQVSNTLYKAQAGVALTLNATLQKTVETIVGEQISKGAVVVMEPSTGDILALASFPTFQPNRLAEYLDQEDAPLFNRTLAAYNCGSVFKTVSALAALESGMSVAQTYNCSGALTVGSNRIKCHHVLGHGVLDMCGGFLQSCNPYFIQLMQQTGGSPLYRLASTLGFDSRILLAEGYATAQATLPSEQALSQETVLANVSFGQGDLLATPIHIAQMTACVVNGGVFYRPNLYLGSVDAAGNLTTSARQSPTRVCSEASAAIVRDMMIGVVEEGTGMSAKPAVASAGGKTGTAETGWGVEDGQTMVQGWFTGFYPAEDPQYVITVLAEDSGRTGESTAKAFASICNQLYRMGYVRN